MKFLNNSKAYNMNKEHYEPATKPVFDLRCQDGNIFAIIGKAARLLRDNLQHGEAREMTERVMKTSSYDEALRVISEYVEFK
jgi:hypothetical protein